MVQKHSGTNCEQSAQHAQQATEKARPIGICEPQEEGHAGRHVPEDPKDREADLTRAGLFQLSYGAASSPAA